MSIASALKQPTAGAPFELFGVNLTATSYEHAVRELLELPASGTRTRVHFCNVHSLVSAQDDAQLRQVFASPAIVFTDGMPLVWLAKLGGHADQRVSGPDIMESVIDGGRAKGYRHFFYGGEAGVPEELAAALTERFPGLQVAGTYSPPFRPLTTEEDQRVVDMINAAAPDFLWVGLGAPKQEFWVAEHRRRLNVPVMLAVGAAFNFHSGRSRRAPMWMQHAGLEWVHRLASEPRRLFGRYASTNLRFAALVLRSRFG
jgi:N-acetylglucosaminyldiphosphoundecaprenol N-acetyl-beta-D-mannosaminyltransferase